MLFLSRSAFLFLAFFSVPFSFSFSFAFHTLIVDTFDMFVSILVCSFSPAGMCMCACVLILNTIIITHFFYFQLFVWTVSLFDAYAGCESYKRSRNKLIRCFESPGQRTTKQKKRTSEMCFNKLHQLFPCICVVRCRIQFTETTNTVLFRYNEEGTYLCVSVHCTHWREKFR